MARKLRVEYPGAIYPVMNRVDRREPIFLGDEDRVLFVQTLAETSQKTGWQVHAYCLMPNHFHLVGEAPRANFVAEMLEWIGEKQGGQHHGEELWESEEQRAERLAGRMLRAAGWKERESRNRPKGDGKKGQRAARLRQETTMSWPWIANRLAMGHWRTAANAVRARTRR